MIPAIGVPDLATLRSLREQGALLGYRGMHIYLRYRAILRLVYGVAARRVLVVGCGYGVFDRLLPAAVELVGVDVADAEIEIASAWAAEHRPGWRYARGTLAEQRFADGAFDLVFVSEVVEHVPAPADRALLAEAARVLAPGGTLVVTVPHRWTARNRARRLFGRSTVWMDRTHLREYRRDEARHLLDGLPVHVDRFASAVLYFPKEATIARVLPPESPVRDAIVAVWPGLASHLLLRATKAV